MDKYFILPPILEDPDERRAQQGHQSYSERNYTKSNSIESYIKTRHFEIALRLTKDYFHTVNVIDFGCADGPFLPSLSKFFNHVVGIDFNNSCIEKSRRLCAKAGLGNVDLICAADSEIAQIKERLGSRKHTILFLLETLEHLGDKDRMYESKIDFLKDAFSLLEDRGLIVVSVPVMVGLPFLLQRAGLRAFGRYREPLSAACLLKAVLFNDTKELQKSWEPCLVHLGFNHRYLEDMFAREFEILSCHRSREYSKENPVTRGRRFSVEKKHLFFQVIYVLRRL